MTYILGLDPGFSTGWAFGMYAEGHPFKLLDHGVEKGSTEEFVEWYKISRWSDRVDATVSERFDIDGTITGTWAPRIEGVLLALAPPSTVIFQGRGDKAALLRGERKRNEWIKERFISSNWQQHDIDACVHIMVYLKRIRHLESLERYWRVEGSRPA